MANQDNNQKGRQGFASMDKEKQRKIASEGGKASGEARRKNNNDRNNE